jgi:hypothetical protein
MQIHDHWLKCKVKILWLTVVSRALLQSIFLLQKLFHTLCVQWCNHWKGCRGRDRMVLDTTLCDKVYKWRATGQWFSPGTLVSSINKTDCHHDHDSPSSDCITEHRVYETVFVAKICFEVMLYLPQSITIF